MARDGWWFVGPALVVFLAGAGTVVSGSTWGWALIALGVFFTLTFSYFFRDPERTPPSDANAIVATADGRILSVVRNDDGSLQIDTFLSVLDVHVNRAPISGRITESIYKPGRFLKAFVGEAGAVNERHDLTHDSPIGIVRSAQIAGILARRIVCRPQVGDELRVGERIGMIKFGSRAQVILPTGFVAQVGPGDRVRAGESIIAVRGDS